MSSLATSAAVTRGLARTISNVRTRPAAVSMFGTSSTATAGRCVERAHLLGRRDLRHHHDIRPAREHRREIVAAARRERIHAHGGDLAGGAPSRRTAPARQRARRGRRSGGVKSSSSWIRTSAPERPAARGRLVRARDEQPRAGGLPSLAGSASVSSNAPCMFISRAIVAAVARCSCACVPLARATVELAEAEVAVRDQGAHPEFAGQRERLPVVRLPPSPRREASRQAAISPSSRSAHGSQIAVVEFAGQRQGPLRDRVRLLQSVREQQRLAQPGHVQRMPDAVAERALVVRHGVLQQRDGLRRLSRSRADESEKPGDERAHERKVPLATPASAARSSTRAASARSPRSTCANARPQDA